MTGGCTQCQDAYEWVATYSDGTTLRECEGDGRPHHVLRNIDQERVVQLAWEPRVGVGPSVSISKPAGAHRLMLARRRQIAFDMDTGGVGRRPAIHVLGWEAPDTQEYTFLLRDGSTVVSSDLNAV